MSVFTVLNQIFGIYALILTIVGTIFNLTSFYVCLRIKNNSTFTIINFLTVVDALTLYFWNLNNFLVPFAGVSVLTSNLWVCKFGSFFQFVSLEASAWLLVAICWDRYFCIYFKHWKTIYFKQPRPLVTAICIIVSLCLINFNILVTFGYDIRLENSTLSFCFELADVPSTKWMTTWGKVHLVLYSILPFILIAIANVLLILNLYSRRRITVSTAPINTQQSTAGLGAVAEAKRASRNEKTNQTVLLMTFFFIAMTSPIACASFFFDILFTTDYGYFIIVFLDCISFSYHGLNFFIMTFSNTRFRKEFFVILKNRS